MIRIASFALAAVVTAGTAQAATFAVFGNNGLDNFISGLPTHSATVVSDHQLATRGFLDTFDAFVYTRDGSGFGQSLSAAAAANVAAFVTGAVVLMNGDFADGVGSGGQLDRLWTNVVNVAANAPNAYIGEFTGAAAALSRNGNQLRPLDLVSGTAGRLGYGNGGANGSLSAGASPLAGTILSGLSMPYNPPTVEFGANLTGIDPTLVAANFNGRSPGIVVSGGDIPAVPVPAPVLLMASAVGLLGATRLWRR